MTTSSTATPLDPRLSRIAAEIHAEIPGCEVRLFGSRARGTARLDSDADLLITVPDGWLAGHDRLQVLGQGRLKVRHGLAGAAMLVPVLSGLLPSVGRPRCHC
jgi:predicted nucleotidyltransferase